MSQRLPPLKSQFQMHESQMTDVPGPFADLDRKNDAFQNHLEHNATLPFDNDTQRHTWLLSHDDISLPPPPFIIEPQCYYNRRGSLLSLCCRLHVLLWRSRNPLTGFKIIHAANPLRSWNHVWAKRILGHRERCGPPSRSAGPLFGL